MSREAVRAIIIKDHNQLLVMKRNKFGTEYYTLVGGGIDVGEDALTALRREFLEESGLNIGVVRHIFTERAGDPFGDQYIFLAEYQGGEPTLGPDSEEAKITALGQNTYEPMWLPVDKLPSTHFLSGSLKEAILDGLKNGWPDEPKLLAWKQSSMPS